MKFQICSVEINIYVQTFLLTNKTVGFKIDFFSKSIFNEECVKSGACGSTLNGCRNYLTVMRRDMSCNVGNVQTGLRLLHLLHLHGSCAPKGWARSEEERRRARDARRDLTWELRNRASARIPLSPALLSDSSVSVFSSLVEEQKLVRKEKKTPPYDLFYFEGERTFLFFSIFFQCVVVRKLLSDGSSAVKGDVLASVVSRIGRDVTVATPFCLPRLPQRRALSAAGMQRNRETDAAHRFPRSVSVRSFCMHFWDRLSCHLFLCTGKR